MTEPRRHGAWLVAVVLGITAGSFSTALPTTLSRETFAQLQVLKLGTVEMTETWRQGDSTFVRLVTRPDFANWVPKGVQGQANAKAIEFHDVSGGVQGMNCRANSEKRLLAYTWRPAGS